MLMDLPGLVQKYDMKISGVLHLGAHLGEEAQTYRDLGIDNVYWVEANTAVIPKLMKRLRPYGHTVIHALVYSENGLNLDFNVTNYDGMSSSIFEFGTHPEFSPDTVFVNKVNLKTRTVDSLVEEFGITGLNFLNMDLQGAELAALQGAEKFLEGVSFVMSEVNKAEVYLGCAKIKELDAFLRVRQFRRVETQWVAGQGWGDALWVRV